jgi:2-keto-3-deoxy-L-rhamnonate aldolase RhmA
MQQYQAQHPTFMNNFAQTINYMASAIDMIKKIIQITQDRFLSLIETILVVETIEATVIEAMEDLK